MVTAEYSSQFILFPHPDVICVVKTLSQTTERIFSRNFRASLSRSPQNSHCLSPFSLCGCLSVGVSSTWEAQENPWLLKAREKAGTKLHLQGSATELLLWPKASFFVFLSRGVTLLCCRIQSCGDFHIQMSWELLPSSAAQG